MTPRAPSAPFRAPSFRPPLRAPFRAPPSRVSAPPFRVF